MKYNWKYIQSGKKVFMVFCQDDRELKRFNDIAYALKQNEDYKDELGNNLEDYILDQKHKLEASWNNKKYTSTINIIKQIEWSKIQKKHKK